MEIRPHAMGTPTATDPEAAPIAPLLANTLEYRSALEKSGTIWEKDNPINGFKRYLIGRLSYLSAEDRQELEAVLEAQGWPPHLRSMDNANWQLEPDSPWSPADGIALTILQHYNVKLEDISGLFFEGRTVDECRRMLKQLPGRPTFSHAADAERTNVECSVPPAAAPRVRNAPMTLIHSSPAAFTDRLLEVSSPAISDNIICRGPGTPIYNNANWAEEVMEKVVKAIQHGMTSHEIRAQVLPFHSLSTIEAMMGLTQETNAMPEVSIKRSPWNSQMPSRVVDPGNTGVPAQVGQHTEPDRTPFQHQELQKKLHQEFAGKALNRIGSVDEKKLEAEYKEEVHSDHPEDEDRVADLPVDNADDDPSYEETTAPAKKKAARTPKVRKASVIGNTPDKKPTSVKSLRTTVLNSISAEFMSPEEKADLRKALNKSGWPTRLCSIEEFNAPPPKTRSQWQAQDTQAVEIIRRLVPKLPVKVMADKFFPGRGEQGVRSQLRKLGS